MGYIDKNAYIKLLRGIVRHRCRNKLDSRSLQFQLLFVLLRQSGYISIEELSKKLHCSETTVIRRIEDIQNYFSQNQHIGIEINKAQGCRLIGNREEVWEFIKELREKKTYIAWRNREERQLLILLKLLSSPSAKSKLSTLGLATNVAESTVLKDIKRLNLLFHPVTINSRPGAGTQVTGDVQSIQIKAMEYCYGILSPMNLIALACEDGAFLLHRIHPCASEVFLDVAREKIDIKTIVQSINNWEATMNVSLSDVAFGNILIYLVIVHLRLISGLQLETTQNHKDFSKLCVHCLLPANIDVEEIQMLGYFLLGLDENILFENCQNIEKQIDILEPICNSIIAYITEHVKDIFIKKEAEKNLLKSLNLLRYRKDKEFVYWEQDIQPLYQGRLRKYDVLIKQLEQIGNNEKYKQWLDLDALLFILDLFVDTNTQSVIDVTLFCVAGTHTAVMMKKMIEKHCPKLRVKKTCSLRSCSSEDLQSNVILSTSENDVLPEHSIIVNSFFDERQWSKVQDKIFNRLMEVQK